MKFLKWIVGVAIVLFVLINFNRIFPRINTAAMRPGIIKEAAVELNWGRDVVTRVTDTIWNSVKPNLGYSKKEIKNGTREYTKQTIENTKNVIDEKTKEAHEESKKQDKKKDTDISNISKK